MIVSQQKFTGILVHHIGFAHVWDLITADHILSISQPILMKEFVGSGIIKSSFALMQEVGSKMVCGSFFLCGPPKHGSESEREKHRGCAQKHHRLPLDTFKRMSKRHQGAGLNVEQCFGMRMRWMRWGRRGLWTPAASLIPTRNVVPDCPSLCTDFQTTHRSSHGPLRSRPLEGQHWLDYDGEFASCGSS